MSRTLAEIVLDEELADREALDRAARQAERDDLPLAVALVRHAGVDELALVGAIRRQMRIPVVDPADVTFDTDALREVPREVCERRRVFPLTLQVFASGPRHMRLAMVDPTDAVAVAEVEHLSGCRVELSLMPLSAIEELVGRAYRGFVTQVMKREATARYRATTHHRVLDAADPELRLRALVRLLVSKGLITEAEHDEMVRQLLKSETEASETE
jgi:hypothetical protein